MVAALALGVSGAPIAQAAPALPTLPQAGPTPPLPELPPLPGLPPLPEAVQLPAPPVNLQPKPKVNQNVRESYLSFGDSVAANPTALDVAVYKTKKNSPNLEWPTIRDGSCAQDPNNFAVQAAKRTGLRLEDYSCPGATAYVEPHGNDAIPHDTVRQQVERAISDRKLDVNTRLVTISAGVNDTYQPNNLPSITTQPQRMARYDEAMTGAINRVKSVAPNAKVILLGIPDETDGHNHTCGSNLLGITSHWYFPLVAYYQDEVREQQRLAALHTGSAFLDMVSEISVQSGKNGCSNDPGRYGASIFDDSPHKLAGHLTDAGHVYYARRIEETYR
ncbi:GDSL-type esterase/lipase family protein [Corynebacterium sp. MSK158]|uniref:GDSL-type esterase/lipase family protein n=1 Tax=Corynebacterium sp. MSK158 TaxID=3050212 RepID=UPI00254DF6A1|nr:GDSL-type esterase/lipase family protein [Corynebacterium sp. MSK158]MDK8694591.1 GDSL-type esterase/lipase family protein [Corynebacterium sp. MSK158]